VRAQINSSALHVFDVLRVVCATATPIGVADIARRLALPTTTVHRALITLEESRYIRRSQNTAKYEPGLMAQLLAWTLFKRFPLSEASMPFLRRLALETGETASMTARIGWYGIRIAVAYGGNDIHHRDRLGETNLLHRSFPGKGIFAFLDDQEIYRYRRFVQLHHHLTSSELERPNLRRQVKLAREQGWAGEEVGLSPGSQAVTLPVRDETGTVIGSMTVNGPVIVGQEHTTTLPRLMAIRDELEALIKAEPGHFKSPYAHFDPERITIRVPEER
jgi:IclR family transcriptional regulator, acetate operon repressor